MLKMIRPVFNLLSSLYGFTSRWLYPLFSTRPFRITIMITNSCNLKCSFCYVKDSLNEPYSELLSLEEWKKIINSIPRTTTISFSGGEVFLTPNFKKIIDFLGQKRRLVSIVTNGTMLTPEICQNLIDNSITYLMVSLDGFKEVHDKMRGAKAFDSACANIKKLIKQRGSHSFPAISIKMVISPENYFQLYDFTLFVHQELKVNSIHYSFLVQNPAQNTFLLSDSFEDKIFEAGNSYTYPPQIVDEIIEQILKIKKYAKKETFTPYFSTKSTNPTFLKNYLTTPRNFNVKICYNPWNEFSIYPDGSITSCITSYIDNIRNLNYDAKKVLHTKNYQFFLAHLRQKFPYYPPCQGCISTKHSRIH